MIRILALSLECFVESERGNATHARECAELAMDVLDGRGLGATPQASWAYVALAQAQADAGKSDDAMRTLELGLSTRRLDNAQAAVGAHPPPPGERADRSPPGTRRSRPRPAWRSSPSA